jgi:hypothetical protein
LAFGHCKSAFGRWKRFPARERREEESKECKLQRANCKMQSSGEDGFPPVRE